MDMVLLSCVILVLLTDEISSRVVTDRGSYNEADGDSSSNVKFSVDVSSIIHNSLCILLLNLETPNGVQSVA